VHHVRVALDDHALGHLDRADLRHAPDVVPPEVHEHHVLGDLLRVREELGGERRILALDRPAWARSGNRAHGELAVLHARHHLRRCARDLVAAERQVEVVR
jgi:hypothetical protein